MPTELPTLLEQFASYGVAGFMGVMWLWERRQSRQREEQLDEAHARIVADRISLDQLMDVVRRNTDALGRLVATHESMLRQMNLNDSQNNDRRRSSV